MNCIHSALGEPLINDPWCLTASQKVLHNVFIYLLDLIYSFYHSHKKKDICLIRADTKLRAEYYANNYKTFTYSKNL